MRIGIIGRAFTDRPSRIIIALLLKSMTMLIPSKYLLLPADGTPIVNIGIVDQSATTSSAGDIFHLFLLMMHAGRKVISSPKEALHQVNQEVSLGKLDDSRHAAHCDGQIFKQRIRMDGCLSKVVHNRFCHGTCSSYFIPRLRPRKLKLDAMFQSCSVCRPTEWDTVEVKLDCPRKNPKELKRKVIKVKKCKCIALSGSNLESDEDGRGANENTRVTGLRRRQSVNNVSSSILLFKHEVESPLSRSTVDFYYIVLGRSTGHYYFEDDGLLLHLFFHYTVPSTDDSKHNWRILTPANFEDILSFCFLRSWTAFVKLAFTVIVRGLEVSETLQKSPMS
ncbi:hypothetical protein DINM_023014 [Dirofilaria immitis]|nr:hypothetical protein [Dirofilaria immitis]